MRVKFILIAFLLTSLFASAQQLPTATVYGKVIDEQGHPIEMANVVVPELLVGYTTNSRGYYELSLLQGTEILQSGSRFSLVLCAPCKDIHSF